MDAFFASVELLAHPEWRGKPLIVGAGPHERGVVSTCSYEARKFGVRSAMPSRTAYALCPQAIFVEPHMEMYEEVSEKAFDVFSRFTPFVEGVSIDEAFLDITGSVHLHGTAERLGERLRSEIRSECGVTCSVGIAPNRLLAKMGSEMRKPDGLTVMPFGRDEIRKFLAGQPIGRLWGIGKKTEAALRPYGITTCGDIQRMDQGRLAAVLGSESAAETLREYAFGTADDTVHWEPSAEKSVSREHTFPVDCADRGEVRETLLRLVGEVGRRFRRERRWASTARLKLRDSDFETITRQMPFPAPARDDIAFRKAALALFDAAVPMRSRIAPLRLIGFGVANISDEPGDGAQMSLFDAPEENARKKRERLSETLDSLRDRGLLH